MMNPSINLWWLPCQRRLIWKFEAWSLRFMGLSDEGPRSRLHRQWRLESPSWQKFFAWFFQSHKKKNWNSTLPLDPNSNYKGLCIEWMSSMRLLSSLMAQMFFLFGICEVASPHTRECRNLTRHKYRTRRHFLRPRNLKKSPYVNPISPVTPLLPPQKAGGDGKQYPKPPKFVIGSTSAETIPTPQPADQNTLQIPSQNLNIR